MVTCLKDRPETRSMSISRPLKGYTPTEVVKFMETHRSLPPPRIDGYTPDEVHSHFLMTGKLPAPKRTQLAPELLPVPSSLLSKYNEFHCNTLAFAFKAWRLNSGNTDLEVNIDPFEDGEEKYLTLKTYIVIGLNLGLDSSGL